jgi:hypothetical protein
VGLRLDARLGDAAAPAPAEGLRPACAAGRRGRRDRGQAHRAGRHRRAGGPAGPYLGRAAGAPRRFR